jgi:hypothetical protein
VSYGLNIQAWCVFLLAAHHVPAERCADVIGSLTGIRPSDGWVHSMLARAAKAVRHVNMLIRALVITAAVLCADETPLRAGPGPKTRKKYLLVACTNLLTYYFLGDRSMKTFDAFVFPDLSGRSSGARRPKSRPNSVSCAAIWRTASGPALATPSTRRSRLSALASADSLWSLPCIAGCCASRRSIGLGRSLRG